MRHRNAGYKLGRNTSHRRAMLRNLVTSVILMDRVETTVTKCKATRPLIEKMITLGKRGTHKVRLFPFGASSTCTLRHSLCGVIPRGYPPHCPAINPFFLMTYGR